MTLEEAQRVAEVLATADSGCSTCIWELCERMNVAVPAFTWSVRMSTLDGREVRPIVVDVKQVQP